MHTNHLNRWNYSAAIVGLGMLFVGQAHAEDFFKNILKRSFFCEETHPDIRRNDKILKARCTASRSDDNSAVFDVIFQDHNHPIWNPPSMDDVAKVQFMVECDIHLHRHLNYPEFYRDVIREMDSWLIQYNEDGEGYYTSPWTAGFDRVWNRVSGETDMVFTLKVRQESNPNFGGSSVIQKISCSVLKDTRGTDEGVSVPYPRGLALYKTTTVNFIPYTPSQDDVWVTDLKYDACPYRHQIEGGLPGILQKWEMSAYDSGLASQVLNDGMAEKIRERRVQRYYNNEIERGIIYDHQITADHDRKFQTVRLTSTQLGRFNASAKAHVVFMHGMGAYTSSASSYHTVLASIAPRPQGTNESTTIGQVKRYSPSIYQPITFEAIDLIGHGAGPNLCNYLDLRSTATWLYDYMSSLRKIHSQQYPKQKLIVVARSASPSIFSEVMKMNASKNQPPLVDGIIFVSPAMPGNHEILAKATKIAMEVIEARDSRLLNLGVFDWYESEIITKIYWTQKPQEYFDFTRNNGKKIPIWILTGSTDTTVIEEERDYYRQFAQDIGPLEYYDIYDTGHDVFQKTKTQSRYSKSKPIPDKAPRDSSKYWKEIKSEYEAYALFYDFITKIINDN